jgi:hypothetical protein
MLPAAPLPLGFRLTARSEAPHGGVVAVLDPVEVVPVADPVEVWALVELELDELLDPPHAANSGTSAASPTAHAATACPVRIPRPIPAPLLVLRRPRT